MNTQQCTELFSFIPHRPPMLLISKLHTTTAELIEADFEITADCIFLRPDNSLEPVAYIEILAQCFAAGSGFLNQDKPITWGYLAAMRGMKIHGKAFLGETLRAKVRQLVELDGIIVVEGELFSKDTLIASGQYKIYIPSNTSTTTTEA